MRHLRILICSFCIVLGLGAISYAQDGRNPPPLIGEPFDRYDGISWDNEKARLDSFAIALLQDPSLTGYIIVYTGKRSCVGEAQRRGLRAKKYLVERRGVDWNRVIWKDAGYLEHPYILLLGQVSGEMSYSFDLPEPLKDVKLNKCQAKANRHKKRRGK